MEQTGPEREFFVDQCERRAGAPRKCHSPAAGDTEPPPGSRCRPAASESSNGSCWPSRSLSRRLAPPHRAPSRSRDAPAAGAARAAGRRDAADGAALATACASHRHSTAARTSTSTSARLPPTGRGRAGRATRSRRAAGGNGYGRGADRRWRVIDERHLQPPRRSPQLGTAPVEQRSHHRRLLDRVRARTPASPAVRNRAPHASGTFPPGRRHDARRRCDAAPIARPCAPTAHNARSAPGPGCWRPRSARRAPASGAARRARRTPAPAPPPGGFRAQPVIDRRRRDTAGQRRRASTSIAMLSGPPDTAEQHHGPRRPTACRRDRHAQIVARSRATSPSEALSGSLALGGGAPFSTSAFMPGSLAP